LTAGGTLATLLLHTFLFTPLIWGGHHSHQKDPNEEGASASRQDPKATASTLTIFQEDTQAIHTSSDSEEHDSRFILPPPHILPIARPRLPAPLLSWPAEADEEVASEADGDQSGHSLMFGRYMGQISARVERAWLRPRSVPKEGSFACRVQIQQDRRGTVEEVTLEKCSQDLQWQASLVKAIEGASPLPAPPDAAVFSNLLTLEFDSDGYVAGKSNEGFAPILPLTASAVGKSPPGAAPASNSGVVERRVRGDGSVDLRIIGSAAASNSQD
jgi:hypothetical protein